MNFARFVSYLLAYCFLGYQRHELCEIRFVLTSLLFFRSFLGYQRHELGEIRFVSVGIRLGIHDLVEFRSLAGLARLL
jgi:hypothetical protein